MKITLDLLSTTGIAALVVFFGNYLVKRIKLLRDFCIPAPVVSGLILSIILCFLKVNHILSVTWTKPLQGWSMNLFFTAVGLGFTATLLRKGGRLCLNMAVVSCILITLQNVVGVALAKLMGTNPLVGVACGSAAMYGGVGTAAAFGPSFEKLGCAGATVIGVAAGTFGMVVASLFGGPAARFLIKHYHLKPLPEDAPQAVQEGKTKAPVLDMKRLMNAFFLLLLTGGLGVPVSLLLKHIPYIEVPYFVGCLFAGVIVRNVMESLHMDLYEAEMNVMEHIMLYLFISITLMTLDLTKLFAVAGPMVVILIGEVVLAVVFGIVVAYRAYGSNYNAAVMVSGLVGVGLGAAPNAVANEKSVMDEFGWANIAWTLFPALSILIGNTYNPIFISLTQKWIATL